MNLGSAYFLESLIPLTFISHSASKFYLPTLLVPLSVYVCVSIYLCIFASLHRCIYLPFSTYLTGHLNSVRLAEEFAAGDSRIASPGRPLVPSRFYGCLREFNKDDFKVGQRGKERQEDAQELLAFFLNKLHSEFRTGKKNTSHFFSKKRRKMGKSRRNRKESFHIFPRCRVTVYFFFRSDCCE